jgi:hypothetical protein
MARVLYSLLAGVLGASVAVGLFLMTARAPFFAPEAYADANDWFGLTIIGDIELALVAFFVVFAISAWVSDRPGTFGFMVGGIGAASILMAGVAFVYHPAPRSLHTIAQVYSVFAWVVLALAFGFVGRALSKRA